jgi:hypothetical protein
MLALRRIPYSPAADLNVASRFNMPNKAGNTLNKAWGNNG